MHKSLVEDGLNLTHPLWIKEVNPKDQYHIFDGITYGKGCFVVRMMLHSLSEEVFRNGINKYLLHKGYKSVSQEELWVFLTDAASKAKVLPEGISMKEIMNTWTLQEGHPVVTAKRFPNGTLHVSQERFYMEAEEKTFANEKEEKGEKEREKWWIPLSISTEPDQNTWDTFPKYWMQSHNHNIQLNPPLKEGDWFLLNVQQTGYFRVNYDAHNWALLSEQFLHNHLIFDEITRAQIIDDVFNFAYAGTVDYKVAINMIKYMAKEESYFVLNSFLTNIDAIDDDDMANPVYYNATRLILSVLIPHYPLEGFMNRTEEMPIVKRTTNKLVQTICRVYIPCINEARQLMDLWLKEPSAVLIDEDLIPTMMSIALNKRSRSELDNIYHKFATTEDHKDKFKYLKALSLSDRSDLLESLLTSLEMDKNEDYLYEGLKMMVKNPHNVQLAWNFLKKNWPKIVKEGKELEYFGAVVPQLRSETQYKELEEFIENSLEGSSITRDFATSVARNIHRKVLFKRRRMDRIRNWASNHMWSIT